MLRAHAPLINQAASGLVRRLTRMHKPGAVQINNAVSGMTMEVIGGVAFGYAQIWCHVAICICMSLHAGLLCSSDPHTITFRLLACMMHTEPRAGSYSDSKS